MQTEVKIRGFSLDNQKALELLGFDRSEKLEVKLRILLKIKIHFILF